MVNDKILNEDRDKAIEELSKFIVLTYNMLIKEGWDWFLSQDLRETESFTRLKHYGKTKRLPISGEGCNRTIYYNPNVNIMGRLWHDITHLSLDLGYTVKEERIVIMAQLRTMKTAGLSVLARKIFWADMYGQAKYYERYNKYVVNQDAFLGSCLTHCINTAILAVH